MYLPTLSAMNEVICVVNKKVITELMMKLVDNTFIMVDMEAGIVTSSLSACTEVGVFCVELHSSVMLFRKSSCIWMVFI